MRILILRKEALRHGKFIRKRESTDVQSDSISIGRSSVNDISLPDPHIGLVHAQIRRSDGGWRIEAVDDHRLRLGRREIRSHDVRPGDQIEIGRFRLEFLAPPAESGEDLSIEITAIGPSRLNAAKPDLLPIGGLRTHLLAVVLTSTVVIAFGVVPFAHDRGLRSGTVRGQLVSNDALPPEQAASALESVFETSWSAGPISRRHAAFAADCAKCHADGASVMDDRCQSCHATQAHIPESSSQTIHDAPCASCHPEHRGGEDLSGRELAECVECHRDLDGPERADDFLTGHPEFRIQLAGTPDRVEWTRDSGLRERSGIHFNHYAHVGQEIPEGARRQSRSNRLDVTSASGVPLHRGEQKALLRCDDCHQLDSGGIRMRPVEYERDCRSCHPIEIGDVELVHGDVDALMIQVRRYDELRSDELKSKRSAKRVSRSASPAGPESLNPSEAVSDDIDRKLRDLLDSEKDECQLCHEMEGGYDRERRAYPRPVPVRIVDSWLPAGGFRHDVHEVVTPCRTCHPRAAVFDAPSKSDDAAELPSWVMQGQFELVEDSGATTPSEGASDILLPDRDVCRDCHAGSRGSPDRIASDCSDCHRFHRTKPRDPAEPYRAPNWHVSTRASSRNANRSLLGSTQ